jgi:hypothetical protein
VFFAILRQGSFADLAPPTMNIFSPMRFSVPYTPAPGACDQSSGLVQFKILSRVSFFVFDDRPASDPGIYSQNSCFSKVRSEYADVPPWQTMATVFPLFYEIIFLLRCDAFPEPVRISPRGYSVFKRVGYPLP